MCCNRQYWTAISHIYPAQGTGSKICFDMPLTISLCHETFSGCPVSAGKTQGSPWMAAQVFHSLSLTFPLTAQQREPGPQPPCTPHHLLNFPGPFNTSSSGTPQTRCSLLSTMSNFADVKRNLDNTLEPTQHWEEKCMYYLVLEDKIG